MNDTGVLNNGPSLWPRMIVGLIGASVSVAPPILVSYGHWFDLVVPPAQPVTVGMFAVLICAWALSVFLTAYMEEDHILKCVLTSIGFPGFVVSLAVGFQGVS